MKVATLILNRNLPDIADKLYEYVDKNSFNNDIYIIEAGSEKNNLSKYCSFYNKTNFARKYGLRFNLGMNYGLYELKKKGIIEKYDYFLFLTNDVQIKTKNFLRVMIKILEKNPRIGLLSALDIESSDKKLLKNKLFKFFWYAHSSFFIIRHELFFKIVNDNTKNYRQYFFDGNNFRGYCNEMELAAKSYANDFGVAITSKVKYIEQEDLLKFQYKNIKTEDYNKNLDLYLNEGLYWLKTKYGFSSQWSMIEFTKLYYEAFFKNFPFLKHNKII